MTIMYNMLKKSTLYHNNYFSVSRLFNYSKAQLGTLKYQLVERFNPWLFSYSHAVMKLCLNGLLPGNLHPSAQIA